MSFKRRRWSWLGPIRILLQIFIILEFVGLPIGVLQLFHGGFVVGTVRLSAVFPHGYPRPAQTTLTLGDVQAFWYPTGALQSSLYGLSHTLGLIVATLPMLIYGYYVTGDALRNDPFTLDMVRKLRILGGLVLFGGLAWQVAAYIANRVLLDIALSTEPAVRDGAGLDPSQYPSLWWLLAGLLLFAFAEVVKRGCQLRAELDEVI